MLSAAEAKRISLTIGRKSLLRKALKDIKFAAKHGDTIIFCDFESRENSKSIIEELKKLGYEAIPVDKNECEFEIRW